MPSGLAAIALPLPALPGSAPDGYTSVNISAWSTILAVAPKTIIAFPATTFTNILQLQVLIPSLNMQIPTIITERSHNLATEGDIERAAAMYLLHDVNLIIEHFVSGLPGIDVFTCIGQSTTGYSRPDIKYVVNGKTVLILEYKRTNTLRDSDWTDAALVRPGRTAQQILHGISPGKQTALTHNAATVSKQASKYSSQCGLVVICNYQNMIVLDLKPALHNARWNDLTNPVKYFFSDGQTITHKQLLLAALIYGLRKAGLQV